jgi:GT2 family glycosyltransferase
MDISIVFVSYRSKDVLKVALPAVYNSVTKYSYEVIIVDNDSSDDTVEFLEKEFLSNPTYAAKTKIIRNENNGFGGGNNRGIDDARGDFILILNCDTKVSPDTLEIMTDFMKSRSDVGISTCKLVKANGELDWACRRSFPDPWVSFFRLSGLSKLFPKNKKLAAYNLTYKSVDEETEIDSCSGAFSFVSRACMEKIKGFDLDYFMYGEDLDLCFRAKQAGFKVWYYPKTTTVHYRGHTSKREPKRTLYAFHDAMWIFYKKHLYPKYPRPFSWLVYVGIWSRYYVKLLENMLRKEKYVSKQ